MKLEAMNGNLLSLTVKVPPADELIDEGVCEGGGTEEEQQKQEQQQQQQQQQQKQQQNHQEEGAEGDKEVGGVGKKKGTRKKRSLNWEEAERCLLVEVIKAKVDYVENRNVDAKSIKAKRLAWMQITKQFNALNFRHRSLEQIQVQWRSMKNSAKREYQQKHPKAGLLEPMDMIEFMEELQKDPASGRSQTRGNGVVIKKEQLLELDDEDTPLAALPTSTNASEDTLQTSTIALPSPPPSAESQNDTQLATPTRSKKKGAQAGAAQKQQAAATPGQHTVGKQKRQRSQNSAQSDAVVPAASTAIAVVADAQPSNLPMSTLAAATPSTSPPAEEKYKKQLFELMKRARLAEMDYARKEHEQKLRFEQMEQELKLNYYRQQQELKLRQLRDEHESRMRHCQAEHEARMRVFTLNVRANNNNAQLKAESHAPDAGAGACD